MQHWWSSSKRGVSPTTQIPIRDDRTRHRSNLWAQAYQELATTDGKLITALEDLIMSPAPLARGKDEVSTQRSRKDGLSPAVQPDKEQQLSTLIESRLKSMNDRKWRLQMGGHTIEVREQVDRIIKIVTVSKDFVSSVASMDPLHAGLPWAGICLLLPLLTNDSKQRSAALDGLEYIAKVVRRFTQIERLYLIDQSSRLTDDLRTTITKLYYLILEFEARAACQFSRNTAHQTLRNVLAADGWDGIWSGIKESETNCEILLRIIDVEDRRARLEKIEELIAKQDQHVVVLLQESRKQDELFQQELLKELQQGRDESRERHLTEDEAKCHECFRTNDYELDKEKNPDRIPGTCEWFLQHDKYRQWLEATGSEWLWVTADPGCGKSVLSRFLVDSFRTFQGSQSRDGHTRVGYTAEDAIICYFFFKDDSESNRSSVNALTSILHQIFAQSHSLIKHALLPFKQNGASLAQLFESLWKIFQSVVADPTAGEIVIFLDALDECEEATRIALIRKIASLFSMNLPKSPVKLLITSRPSTPIGDQIWRGKVDPASIRLMGENEAEMEAISVEIEMVIRERIHQFKELRRYRGVDDNVHVALLNRLLQVGNRTYLWVSLIFPELERYAGLSEKKLLEALQTIPTTINDAYERILSHSSDLRQARKLLNIVIGALRPFTLDEMNVALAITDNSHCLEDLDLESPISFRTTVRDLCGLFVSIRDSKIYLIHQTAKEFLLNEDYEVEDYLGAGERLELVHWQQSMNLQTCYTVIVKICVVYLSFSDFEQCPFIPAKRRGDDLFTVTVKYLFKHPFLEYSANYWWLHYAYLDIDSDGIERILKICNPKSKRCQNWFQVKWMFTESRTCHPKGFNEIVMAAYFGWEELVQPLCDRGISIDVTDYHSRSALWWALEKGNETTACTMIACYFDTFDNIDSIAVLQMACTLGRASVVKFLVQCFDVGGHLPASDGWTAFRRAAIQRHTPVLDVFLRHSSDGTLTEEKEFALHQVVGNEDYDIAKYLIDQGVDLEAKSPDGETALYRCVANGQKAIAELLLQHGANPNTLSNNQWNEGGNTHGETALYRAVYDGDKEMVNLLLEYDAEVDACSRCSETALYRGAHGDAPDVNQARDIVKLLLDRGADINAKTGTGDTPLRRAKKDGCPVGTMMENHAKNLGIDTASISQSPHEKVLSEEDKRRQFSIIEESELLDTENFSAILELDDEDFSDILELDDEDDGPDRDFTRSVLSQSFWDTGKQVNKLRDAIIRKRVFDMASCASGVKEFCSTVVFVKVVESCQRLQLYKPDYEDGDSRVTEEQWADMTKELLIVEQSLADTKALLQRYYRAVTASTMDVCSGV